MKEWVRERRARFERKTQVEKDQALEARIDGLLESVWSVESQYYGIVTDRMEDIDYDWRDRSDTERLELFDRAARDAAPYLRDELARYLEERVRDRFVDDKFGLS
jgi:hypothetical protein